MASENLLSEGVGNTEKILSKTATDSNYLTENQEIVHHEDQRSVEKLMEEMEALINAEDAGAKHKAFGVLRNLALSKINTETEREKEKHVESGSAELFNWEHPFLAKVNAFAGIFKEKYDIFLKNQEQEQEQNLEIRKEIIERLKNLYTNPEPGVNLFKVIREIKELWANAGKVAKSQFKILNNDYFHHLNQFYVMVDMNKEFLEQEYSHNLEKRRHIISRAKELEQEPIIQKALNELQYLHKLWKEEAEPVAEEFRDQTWEEFKDISNRIHSRKSELSAHIEEEQNRNLEKKNAIISEIEKLTAPEKEANHNHWQKAIKRVEELRIEFLNLGSVPRNLSNQNWTLFKQTLRHFNDTKNKFYKSMKGSQVANLERKEQLIQIAKDNAGSEDWDTVVPLFKKLQEEWKTIGHVPRSQANRVWGEFRDVCNQFFDHYRQKSNDVEEDWKENYSKKKALLEELKAITEAGSIEKIEAIKSQWNAIGKVPRANMSINFEFNKTLKEKLKINKITEFDLKDGNLSDAQIMDKVRKLKNQISDLEAQITTLENNLEFFSNPTRENPLLADTFSKIDEKKEELKSLKVLFHEMISVG